MSGARSSLRAILTGVLGISMATALRAGAADQDTARTFSFTYEVDIPAQPAGTGSVVVFLPLAESDAHQTILRHDVNARVPRRETVDCQYGDRHCLGHVYR